MKIHSQIRTQTKENRRKVIIDTNVILFDALAILKFRHVDVHIPLSVIEEVDKFKRDPGENGRNARQFSRFIDTLRAKGSLSEGVFLEDSDINLIVHADFTMTTLPSQLDPNHPDNRILATALTLKKHNPKAIVELITKDINLRIKADVLGIQARDYEPEETTSHELYEGYKELTIDTQQMDQFFKQKQLALTEHKLVPNQYVILKVQGQPSQSALGRYCAQSQAIVPLNIPPSGVWGIQPRNVEQTFALDALLNDDILLVSLVGKAGTGKTLLAIAAGLAKSLDEGVYQRLLVSRPIFPMGRDLGYLPGDIEQKLNPWMQPIFDNVEFLMGNDKKAAGRAQELINQGMLNIEPLTYIRGRSIPKQFLIVDEAQNLTPHEIKTIITRAGQGTKIVLTGDIYQIDNPYVDSATSGLTYAVEKFKGYPIFAHITLVKGERSPLAELAANIL